MIRGRAFVPACLTLLLSGCLVGPNYKRPQIATPSQFRTQKIAEQSSLADLPWWEVFKDPALKNLVQTSLTNNYDLRIAVTRIEQARQLAIQSRSQLFPQINYSANTGGTRPAIVGLPFNIPFQSTLVASLSMSWEIDVWGRIRRSNEAALAQLLATDEARRGVLLSLTSELAQAYFELLGLDLQLEISRKNQASFQRSFDIFNERFQNGIVSKLETARSEASLATVTATIPELERQIVIKENQIRVLLGENPESVQRAAKLLDEVVPPEIPAGLPSALLERRPDVRQAEALVRSANARIGVATANYFPKIGLTALFGRQSAPLESITKGAAATWNILPNATGPIFQGGNLKAQKKQAIAVWQETQLQYQQTALTAFQEVANALISREKYEQVRAEQERAVRAYEVSLDVATQRYIAGKASYLDVISAQQEIFPAEQSLAQTELNRRIVLVQLYRALGGGWNLQTPAAWSGTPPPPKP